MGTGANVRIKLGGTPSSPEQAAAAAWDNALLSYYTCAPYFMLSGSTATPTATINMTYGSITDSTSSGDDDSIATSTTITVTRGVTDFTHATTSGGFISTISIQINSMVTASAAIQEVVAHELGHTLNLYDCNYPGCPVNSSVMESSQTLIPGTTINSTIGQPGPTICDYSCLSCANNVNYFCPPPPPPPGCQCPGGCPPCTLVITRGEAIKPDSGGDCCVGNTPVLLDISGKGYDLTSAAGGVSFDMSGTNHPIQTAWTAQGANNVFLVLPGADGLVHNGRELFGNYTPQPPSKNPNGFAALAVYDDPKNGGNGNGMIDPGDAIYS
jgi:hypothetical protein